MNESNGQRDFLKELEHTENALQDLLEVLIRLNSALTPIEREMRVSDFSSSGEIVQGTSKGIVCVLSGLIQGDPLQLILKERGRGKHIPSLIKAGDRTESEVTVESIVNMLHSEQQRRTLEYVINLRWAEIPAPLETENVVIRGNRYELGDSIRIRKLETNLEELGFKVVIDDGEFGGGPLTYEITKTFRDTRNLLVCELTLSRQVVENDDAVFQILNMLASF